MVSDEPVSEVTPADPVRFDLRLLWTYVLSFSIALLLLSAPYLAS